MGNDKIVIPKREDTYWVLCFPIDSTPMEFVTQLVELFNRHKMHQVHGMVFRDRGMYKVAFCSHVHYDTLDAVRNTVFKNTGIKLEIERITRDI